MRLRKGSLPRRLLPLSARRRRSVHGGSDTVAECPRLISPHCLAGICHSANGKRSPCRERRVLASDRSPEDWAARLRRSRGNCAATQRLGAANSHYRASVAQWKAELVAQRPKSAKLVANDQLREYVQERLSGQVRRPNPTLVAGPGNVGWKGRGKPHRQDRRWVTPGARSKSRNGSRSTSLMMSPCGSAMRRSIRRSTSKAVARSSASWSPAYARDEPCVFPARGHGGQLGHT